VAARAVCCEPVSRQEFPVSSIRARPNAGTERQTENKRIGGRCTLSAEPLRNFSKSAGSKSCSSRRAVRRLTQPAQHDVGLGHLEARHVEKDQRFLTAWNLLDELSIDGATLEA
jgi:hypothetical protein